MSKDQIELIVQPEAGATPLIQAIDGAETTVDILIFRLDRREFEFALVRAVQRGVRVRALIAHTSSGGEKSLRALEMRLLKAGVTVSRTSDDLSRYHGKMMIIDQKELFVLGFNFTYIDIDRSRSFGVAIKDHKLVEEALKLFEADSARQEYRPADPRFLVSPLNARKSLAEFLKGASKELLIYDPNISDKAMLRILDERAKAGITIRAIGGSLGIPVRKLGDSRLHIRMIVRDETDFFLGSQSLRGSELDKRREIGIILEDPKMSAALKETFEKDWKVSEPAPGAAVELPIPVGKIAKKVAKAVAKEMPVAEAIEGAMKDLAGADKNLQLGADLEETVKSAVKAAVKNAVREAVEEAKAV